VSSPPGLSPATREALVAVARLRLGLPEGELVGDIHPFWPSEFEGIWALRLAGGERGRVVVLMVDGEDVVAHAGLDRAARRLQDLRLLNRPAPHTTESVRPLLDAVGGLSPASPTEPNESFESRSDAGVRVVFSQAADWVRFAASGALGVPPAEGITGFGVRAPVPMGRMVCDIDPDYRLTWRYVVDDVEIGAFEGYAGATGTSPADELPTLQAEQLICTARMKTRRPWAVPAQPVRAVSGDDGGTAWEVTFLGGERVSVEHSDLAAGTPGSRQR
jgi:hypothetical protein